ncbi:MAG: NADH:ubiquinone reductase (Na(+)-transporting) subunit C [Bacteroidetes bacterium]|nr:MAG: NADH:ubiquinone reductase (Na(+)-transporting) subunit C [Bacteroidota bacterium]MBL1144577.1 NADH:ubiquinone reductase (Na(+)-transporting) subunit C [Bacteroidota bacterium]NOG57372.1 NADH:ubiquinone reductase (Na(+)-transporting) subunit C [Bacteroidota bacterium]
MDVNKNSYTFAFSAILVIVVAAVLAFAAESLKPMQKENMRLEKMQNILASVKIEATPEQASSMFEKYIVDQKLLNSQGEVVTPSGITAFDVDVVKEFRTIDEKNRNYPLFIFEENGERKYIVPLVGKGLWGPIWGYVAFDGDMNTVYGSTFDHKSETPGLGAEINTNEFQDKFIGKSIFDNNGNYESIHVLKGGTDVVGNQHAVDGISGGTITSNGVGEMIQRTLNIYVPYFKGNQKASL